MSDPTRLSPFRESRQGESEVSLTELLAVIERRRWAVLIPLAVALLASLAFLLTAPPTHRAEATLRIDPGIATSGVFGQLATLTSAPAASAEIAVLRSREIARRVVEAPEGLDPLEGAADGHPRHLGLATRVDELRPFSFGALTDPVGVRDEEGAALRAWVSARSPDAPEALFLRLLAADRVLVAPRGWLDRLTLEPQGEEYLLGTDALTCFGFELRLLPDGDLTGRCFEVRAFDAADAIADVLRHTEVTELERNSGVVRVSVTDRDPVRAARIANALCDNYLDLNVARGRKSAAQATDFIDGQLDSQLAALERAERELVELKSREPGTIDVPATAQALIGQVAELESEKIRAQLTSRALQEALELLEQGRFDALARLESQLSDPITIGYLQTISRLVAESETQGRSESGAYKLLLLSKLGELRAHGEQLELRRDELERVVNALVDGDESSLARLGEGAAAIDPVTQSLLEELAGLRARGVELRQQFTPSHPQVLENARAAVELTGLITAQLRSRSDGLTRAAEENSGLVGEHEGLLARFDTEERGALDGAVERLRARTLEHLRSRRAGLDSHAASIEEQISSCEARMARLPEAQRIQAGPLRAVETHRQIVELLLQSRQQAEVTKASTVATAEMIDYATPPRHRAFPRAIPTLGLGAVLGLLLGVCLAFVRERLRDSIQSEAALEEATRLPVFGTIPRFRRRRRRRRLPFIPTRDDPGGGAAEAYRSLRANFHYACADGGEFRTLSVTSCAPGEGKTTANICLAMVFASQGKRVLLVDVDMRRHSVGRYLGLPDSPGLAGVLHAGQSWRELVVPSGFDGLDVLPAGSLPRDAADPLNGRLFEDLVDEWVAAYDLVVFDAPPALAVADVRVFAHKVDALVLLYRSDGLPAPAVSQALRSLVQAGAHVAGCALNMHHTTRHDASYQSYYGAEIYHDKAHVA